MKRRRALLLVGAGVAALALAGAVTAGVLLLRSGDEPGDYRGSRPPDGMMLPDFTLPDYEGESVSTQELRGTVVLVTFLDARCTEACLRLRATSRRAASDRRGFDARRPRRPL